MRNKCSTFHRCTSRGLNFIETVYELFDNPSYIILHFNSSVFESNIAGIKVVLHHANVYIASDSVFLSPVSTFSEYNFAKIKVPAFLKSCFETEIIKFFKYSTFQL